MHPQIFFTLRLNDRNVANCRDIWARRCVAFPVAFCRSSSRPFIFCNPMTFFMICASESPLLADTHPISALYRAGALPMNTRISLSQAQSSWHTIFELFTCFLCSLCLHDPMQQIAQTSVHLCSHHACELRTIIRIPGHIWPQFSRPRALGRLHRVGKVPDLVRQFLRYHTAPAEDREAVLQRYVVQGLIQ